MRKQRRELATWLSFVDCTGIKAFVELTVTKTIRAGAQNLLMVKTDQKPQRFSFYKLLNTTNSLSFAQPVACHAQGYPVQNLGPNDFAQLNLTCSFFLSSSTNCAEFFIG